MILNNNQAIKIATMMLQAATYQTAWIELHPIMAPREGREGTYQSIAKALALLTDADEQAMLKQLEQSNGNNVMVVSMSEAHVEHLRKEYQNAPVYQDAKGRQYIMFNGVRTQNYDYQIIDVARYVDFTPTEKYHNIDNLVRNHGKEKD